MSSVFYKDQVLWQQLMVDCIEFKSIFFTSEHNMELGLLLRKACSMLLNEGKCSLLDDCTGKSVSRKAKKPIPSRKKA